MGGTLLRVSMDTLSGAGEIAPASQPIERLLSGASDAAALEIAQATDRRKARKEIGEALDWLIEAIRAHATRPPQHARRKRRK